MMTIVQWSVTQSCVINPGWLWKNQAPAGTIHLAAVSILLPLIYSRQSHRWEYQKRQEMTNNDQVIRSQKFIISCFFSPGQILIHFIMYMIFQQQDVHIDCNMCWTISIILYNCLHKCSSGLPPCGLMLHCTQFSIILKYWKFEA